MINRLIFAALLLSLSSCGLLKKKPEVVVKNPNIRLSGRVQVVNEKGRFVLIRRYGPWRADERDIVESRGEGRAANLMPTGEKLGEHVAADIRSGDVEVGDAVYIRRITKAKSPESSDSPDMPPKAENKPETAETR